MVIHFCIFFPIDSNNSYQGIHKFNEYRHLLDPLLIDNMWLLLKHAKKKKKYIHCFLLQIFMYKLSSPSNLELDPLQ